MYSAQSLFCCWGSSHLAFAESYSYMIFTHFIHDLKDTDTRFEMAMQYTQNCYIPQYDNEHQSMTPLSWYILFTNLLSCFLHIEPCCHGLKTFGSLDDHHTQEWSFVQVSNSCPQIITLKKDVVPQLQNHPPLTNQELQRWLAQQGRNGGWTPSNHNNTPLSHPSRPSTPLSYSNRPAQPSSRSITSNGSHSVESQIQASRPSDSPAKKKVNFTTYFVLTWSHFLSPSSDAYSPQ